MELHILQNGCESPQMLYNNLHVGVTLGLATIPKKTNIAKLFFCIILSNEQNCDESFKWRKLKFDKRK